MILAEKIMKLRKQQGWSQEDLALRMDISRQSVSKWESGASIPDLDKILKLSNLFGVSTDFLLKDEMEEIPVTEIEKSSEAKELNVTPATSESGNTTFEPTTSWGRTVSVEEANTYMNLVEKAARRVAAAVAGCILSPVVLILLAGLAEGPGGVSERVPGSIVTGGAGVNAAGRWITENTASGIGMIVLLLMVAASVAVFILNGMQMKKYEYLENEPITLEYGVAGIVEKKREEFAPIHRRCIAAGVALCIACAVPLMMALAFEVQEMVAVFCLDMILILVALGVYMFVWSGMIAGSYEKLLEEGDYTLAKKIEKKRNENISRVYWCAILAIYLGYSFISGQWTISWVIWPCAAVLFAAVCGVAAMIRKK